MSQGSTQKLRILALHGYTQNAEIFSHKSPLHRKFKKLADFVFVTAPFQVGVDDPDLGPKDKEDEREFQQPNLIRRRIIDVEGAFSIEEEPVDPKDYPVEGTEMFGWYLRRPNLTKTGHYYRGITECIQFLENIFEKQGPFDGVFGFSQGACLVTMLCALQQKKLTKHIKFDFAIIAGGFKFIMEDFYTEPLRIPSLHIYGETDQRVSPERARNLAECFVNPFVVPHEGGHFVPCNAAQKVMYEPFFVEQWKRKFSS